MNLCDLCEDFPQCAAAPVVMRGTHCDVLLTSQYLARALQFLLGAFLNFPAVCRCLRSPILVSRNVLLAYECRREVTYVMRPACDLLICRCALLARSGCGQP